MAFSKLVSFPKGDVCITVVNPRLILISPLLPNVETLDKDGNIISLDFGEGHVYDINKPIKLGKQLYKIQVIKKETTISTNGVGYYLFTQKKVTKTSNFILPFMGGNRNSFRWSSNFVNAFIGTEECGDWGNSIYMLYRFDGSKSFVDFEEELCNHPWYVNKSDPDKFHTLFQFDIPDNLKEDVSLLINGRYSQIQEENKKRILEFNLSSKDRPMGQILYKDPKRKLKLEEELGDKIPNGNELYDPFYVEDELFFNKYIIEDDGPREECTTI